ncbi:MAG: thiamine phosphate synthase, partial [Mesorhizobium sp.]
MNEATPPNRCRIVLIAPPLVTPEHICTAFDGDAGGLRDRHDLLGEGLEGG